MTKKLVLKSDHSIEIVATKEVVFGTCNIIDASLDANGEIQVEWCGYTEIDWNSQRTVRRGDLRIFVDENGHEYSEQMLELIDVAEEEDGREPANEQAYYKALLDRPADDTRCACSNCGTAWRYDQLKAIGECVLTPGDPSPAGRCADPECDSLAYIDEEEADQAFAHKVTNFMFGDP